MFPFISRTLFGSKPHQPQAKADGPEDIKGIANVTGKVRGHANGLINFGEASPSGKGSRQATQAGSDLNQQAEAVLKLAEAVGKLDGSYNGPAGGVNAPAAGTKKVRGLTNVTGNVEGTGNGGINFGGLTWDDDSAKKGTQKKKVTKH